MSANDEELILNNTKIAYKIAWDYYNKFQRKIELDELQSLSLLGLTKAAKTYNSNLDFSFSTYAYRCIQNEILLFMRKYRQNSSNISLSTLLSETVELQDTIPLEYDLLDKIKDDLDIQKLQTEINNLSPRFRIIIKYRLERIYYKTNRRNIRYKSIIS